MRSCGIVLSLTLTLVLVLSLAAKAVSVSSSFETSASWTTLFTTTTHGTSANIASPAVSATAALATATATHAANFNVSTGATTATATLDAAVSSGSLVANKSNPAKHAEHVLRSLEFVEETVANALEIFGGAEYKKLQHDSQVKDQLDVLEKSVLSELVGYVEKQGDGEPSDTIVVVMVAFAAKLLNRLLDNTATSVNTDLGKNDKQLHFTLKLAAVTFEHTLGLFDQSATKILQTAEIQDKFKTLSSEMELYLMNIGSSIIPESENHRRVRLSRRLRNWAIPGFLVLLAMYIFYIRIKFLLYGKI